MGNVLLSDLDDLCLGGARGGEHRVHNGVVLSGRQELNEVCLLLENSIEGWKIHLPLSRIGLYPGRGRKKQSE